MNILNLILVSSYYTILCNGFTPVYNRGVTSFISSSTKKYQLNNNKRQVVRTTDTLQDNQKKVKSVYLPTLLFAKEKNDIMLSDDFDGNDDVDDESIDLSKEVLNDFDYILFKERQAEISALGGDPAFFTPSDLQAEEEEEEEEVEENLSDSSFSFMSSLSQMQGIEQITKTIQKYETNPIPPAPETDSEPVKSFVTYDDDDDDYYDLDFIGGDPGFLIEEDSEEKKDEGDFLWDGEVDEDAHLDL